MADASTDPSIPSIYLRPIQTALSYNSDQDRYRRQNSETSSGRHGTVPESRIVDSRPQKLPLATETSGQALDNDNTPDSGGVEREPESIPTGASTEASNDLKRSRACDACRALKVRCDQDPLYPDVPCKRCEKANRPCIITPPSRKRQRKADNKVAELEKKIDALTAKLQTQRQNSREDYIEASFGCDQPSSASQSPAAGSPQQHQDDQGIHQNQREPVRSGSNGVGYARPTSASGLPRYQTASAPHSSPKRRRLEDLPRPDTSNERYNASQERKMEPDAGPFECPGAPCPEGPFVGKPHSKSLAADRSDIRKKIDQFMDLPTADRGFDRFVNGLAKHCPVVMFPPGTTAKSVRESKPILFLAILAVAADYNLPRETRKRLWDEMSSQLANFILREGEKSIEIIQALQVTTLWHRPAEFYEKNTFYQHLHIAAIMAIDIGLGRPHHRMRTAFFGGDPASHKFFPNPEAAESRRAWLGCYYLCVSVGMILKRPIVIRWTNYMEDCVKYLETSSEALPSDKILCHNVRLAHLCEEVGTQFSMDDPMASVTISDPKTGYAIKMFECQLKEWAAQSPKGFHSSIFKFNEHVASLYIHEIAMHFNHNIEDFRAPFTEDSLAGPEEQASPISAAQMTGLSDCLAAAQGIIETFLDLTPDRIECLPVPFFIRTAYAVVILIKLDVMISRPSSQLSKIMSRADLRIEYYLDALIHLLSLFSANDIGPANKVLQIISRLRDWYLAKRDGGKRTRDHNDGGKQHLGAGWASPKPANTEPPTSLHVLSNAAVDHGLNGSAGSRSDVHSSALTTQLPPTYGQTQSSHIPANAPPLVSGPTGWYAPNLFDVSADTTQGLGSAFDPSSLGTNTGFGLGLLPPLDFSFGGLGEDLSGLFVADGLLTYGSGENGAEFSQGWS